MIFGLSYAQILAPEIQWEKTYGGTNYDIANSVEMTSDGGYIMAGYTNSTDGDLAGRTGTGNDSDFWVVKVDSAGAIEWHKVFGGSDTDDARQVRQLSDGTYIIGGSRVFPTGTNRNIDFWLIKIDQTGNLQWTKRYGGTGRDELHSLKATSDGGYIMAGWTASDDGDISNYHGSNDGWVVKINSQGNIQYTKTLGGSNIDMLESVEQTTDGGYIVAGLTRSRDGDVSNYYGNYDGWLVKLDATLNIQWQKTYGTTSWDEFKSVRQTTDGGYIAGGTSGEKFWLVKTDASGNLQWEKKVGGSREDQGHAVRQTRDGGYIMAGWAYSYDGEVSENKGFRDWWVVRFDSSGNLLWEKSMGSSAFDNAYDIEQTPDGGYIVAGYSNAQDGDVSHHRGSPDFWLVKLKPDDVSMGISDVDLPKFKIYPNPVQSNLKLVNAPQEFDYKIVDILGRTHKVGANDLNIELSDLASGQYLLILQHAQGKTTRKFLKE